jgi:hypothetical protein
MKTSPKLKTEVANRRRAARSTAAQGAIGDVKATQREGVAEGSSEDLLSLLSQVAESADASSAFDIVIDRVLDLQGIRGPMRSDVKQHLLDWLEIDPVLKGQLDCVLADTKSET